MEQFKAIDTEGKVTMVSLTDEEYNDLLAKELSPVDFDCLMIFTDPEELEKLIVDLITKK